MNGLLKRLEKIQKECVDAVDKTKQINADGTTDAFTLLRRKIGLDIKGVKEMIKERDESEMASPGAVKTVTLSHTIRTAIADLKRECQKLQKMHNRSEERYRSKGKDNPEKQKKIDLTRETCQLAWAHIKELEMLNKKRGSEHSQFVPRDHNQTGSNNGEGRSTVTQLPDLDNEDFKELIRNDRKIDSALDEIGKHLQTTANIANEMYKAADRQGVLLDGLNNKADIIDEKLDNLNMRLTRMIKDVRKVDKFIIDVILVCVLLGIIGAIVSVAKK